jgi:hypothetical protein
MSWCRPIAVALSILLCCSRCVSVTAPDVGTRGMSTSAPDVFASHFPMHPSETESVTFRGHASAGVRRIRLQYQLFEWQGRQEVPVGAPVVVKTCDAVTTAAFTCEGTVSAFPARSLVEFSTAALDDTDTALATDTYRFAAGTFPWPREAIPIRVTSTTAAGIDIVLIRDDPDLSKAEFREGVPTLISETFFGRSATIRSGRQHINFYYTSFTSHYTPTCGFPDSVTDNAAELLAGADTLVILHKTKLQDCREGKVFSTEINIPKSVIHESGHALFGVNDEYCSSTTSYPKQACLPNVYKSLSACESDAADVGLPKTACRKIATSTCDVGRWRIDPTDPEPGCVMGPAQHDADWVYGPACVRRATAVFDNCRRGKCYPVCQ